MSVHCYFTITTLTVRAVDLHSFFSDPDPAVILNADPDVDSDPEPALQNFFKKITL